jgi:hypothetical protein
MKPKGIRKKLIRSWVGTLFLHVLLLPPWTVYLAVKPIQAWSVADVLSVLCLWISGYIVLFWTLYLWGAGSRTIKRVLLKYGSLPYRFGQLFTILLLVFIAIQVASEVVLNSGVLGEPFTLEYCFFWGVIVAQGIQHYLYKMTSSSPRGKDGLFEMLERKQPIDWCKPLGGSIGVELRRLNGSEAEARQ